MKLIKLPPNVTKLSESAILLLQDRLNKENSNLITMLLLAKRGEERPSETWLLKDDLAITYNQHLENHRLVRQEIDYHIKYHGNTKLIRKRN